MMNASIIEKLRRAVDQAQTLVTVALVALAILEIGYDAGVADALIENGITDAE